MTDWEALYARDEQLNRWPFDSVVSFVLGHRPDKPRDQTTLLEVGCGAGNNLWFAASEGLRVAGVEASPTAVEHARRRLADAGLEGDVRVGGLTPLPFADASFDLALDRAALTCVPEAACAEALAELRRVVAPGGKLLFTPYSAAQTVREGYIWPGIAFYDEAAIHRVTMGWERRSVQHVVTEDGGDRYAEWRVVLERT